MKTAEEIADYLMGTCKSLDDALEELDSEGADDMAFCLQLDGLVFCCDVCSWWSCVSEMGSDMVCLECEDGR